MLINFEYETIIELNRDWKNINEVSDTLWYDPNTKSTLICTLKLPKGLEDFMIMLGAEKKLYPDVRETRTPKICGIKVEQIESNTLRFVSKDVRQAIIKYKKIKDELTKGDYIIINRKCKNIETKNIPKRCFVKNQVTLK